MNVLNPITVTLATRRYRLRQPSAINHLALARVYCANALVDPALADWLGTIDKQLAALPPAAAAAASEAARLVGVSSEDALFALFGYVDADLGGGVYLPLDSAGAINTHAPTVRVLSDLEALAVEHIFGRVSRWSFPSVAVPPQTYRPAKTQNVEPFIADLLANHYCTLAELRTVYTLEDAYAMSEALFIDKINEWRAAEAAAKENK